MHKLLCIVGPTGTGKTALALKLAAKQPSILVSADSRQVYRGMDIVTGKDHPPHTILYGIDLVNPGEPCSVSIWYDVVMPHIIQAWEEGKLPIIVGGTGLYVKALTSGIATIQVPINQPLRGQLIPLSIAELQTKLRNLDPRKLVSLNHSDQHNPRRLIRAIEVVMSPDLPESKIFNLESKLIGLRYFDDSNYRSIITARVQKRLSSGAIAETERLIKSASPQAFTAIGYHRIVDYIEGKSTKEAMVEHWVSDELAYAKRQMTWFRKDNSIKWYDASKGGYDYPKN